MQPCTSLHTTVGECSHASTTSEPFLPLSLVDPTISKVIYAFAVLQVPLPLSLVDRCSNVEYAILRVHISDVREHHKSATRTTS
eukprot:1858955-Ditylum_brightwellii.AAC.1